jgi:hypothetical protein
MQQWRFNNNSNQLNIFRAMISPIFRSTRLCLRACGVMHPRCCRPVAWKRSSSASRRPAGNIVGAQSSAPEDGRNHYPKHVELIGIINKPLLFHLVGCLYYLFQWCTVKQISNSQFVWLKAGVAQSAQWLGWPIRPSISSWKRGFLFSKEFHTGCVAHPAYCSKGNVALSVVVKR